MRHPALVLLLTAPVALAASAAPPKPASAGSSFSADPRLQAPLTLAVKDRPLEEVVRDVGRKCGVKLIAARQTADDKATVLVDQRPAGETLARVAEHFGFVWVRAGEGWELTQSLVAQRTERELWLGDLEPIRREANETAAVLDKPQKELLDRVKEIDARLAEGAPPGERPRLLREKQLLLNAALSQPGVPRMSVDLFRSLRDEATALLLDGDPLRLSTANHSLSDAVAKQVQAATNVGDDAGEQRQAEVVVWLAEGGADHEFGPQPRKDRSLALNISYNSVRGTGERYRIIGARWSAGSLEPRQAPQPVPDEPFYQRSLELTLPGPEKAQPAFFSPGPREARRSLENVWPGWPSVGDLAEAVHRAGGPQVIADSFVSARFDPSLLRGKRTLADVLRFLDGELDYGWKRDGDLLYLRSRRFYRDRRAEVPERIIRPWARRVSSQGEMTLDDLSELAVALRNPQVRSVQDYWGWYLHDAEIAPPDWFYGNRHHLRLWGGLNAAQRAQARAGGLAAGMLQLAQQNAWKAGLFSAPETLYTPSDFTRSPSDAELAMGGFTLQQRDVQEQLFTRVSPDGKSRTASSIVSDAGPAPPRFGGDQEGAPRPDGPPTLMTEYQFRYHLAGEEQPARTVRFSIPKLKRTAK